MEQQPNPLAGHLAALRAANSAEHDRGWLPASLHALIMACLARIFGRLEQLILLWQAGSLVLPTAPPAAYLPAARSPSVILRETKDPRFLPTAASQTAPLAPPPATRASRLCRLSVTPGMARTCALNRPTLVAPPPGATLARPRPAHDPPPTVLRPQKPLSTRGRKHAIIITLLQ